MLWILTIGLLANTLGLLVLIHNLIKRSKSKGKSDLYNYDLGVMTLNSFVTNLNYYINNMNGSKLGVVVMSVDLEEINNLTSLIGIDERKSLLREAVMRVKGCIRINDIVCYNGKTLIISLTRVTGFDDINKIALRLLETFNEPFSYQGRSYNITTNIGISTSPENGNNPDILISNAETAMSKAREVKYSNHLFYTDELNNKVKENEMLLRDLKDALILEQFELHYQPLYSISQNKVVAVEALIRWNHPEKGMIPPNNFIPLAESSGLIVDIGYWVMRRAFKDFLKWGRTDLKLSINLSALQFGQEDLVSRIKEIIEQETIQPSNICLEITESTSMTDIKRTVNILNNLRGIGLTISVDDFGTGYSSLSYLRKLPVETIKIDRSFINGIEDEDSSEVLVESIVSLAHNLGLDVVAEGVETKEQFKFLENLNCDLIQGYYISRPQPFDKIMELLKKDNGY